MNVDINDENKLITDKDLVLIQEVLVFAAKKESIPDNSEVSISIVDNEGIQALNKVYRQKDMPTDVLSFPMDETLEDTETDMPNMLGDIIISIDKVNEQKETYNHSFERELAFLTIHGLLHLLGYTHDNPANEEKMFEKQKLILKEFGLER